MVLVGFDMELTTLKLRNTCEILSTQDVVYLATNPDWVCPVSFGFIPDCGSICGMIKNATGKWPTFIGKPEPTMVNIVMKKFGASRTDTVVVGDRLYTDIATGINADVTTVCVLTGETTVEEIEKGETKPTLTFGSVKNILDVIKSEKEESQKTLQLSQKAIRRKLTSDIIRCEEILETKNEQMAASFVYNLFEDYDLLPVDKKSPLELLAYLKQQLIKALRD